jgi:hypothetical protein
VRLNAPTAIAGATLIVGLVFQRSYLWLPATVLAAGFIDLFTRRWVASKYAGNWPTASTFLKFVCALISFYAIVGQVACLVLIAIWFLS